MAASKAHRPNGVTVRRLDLTTHCIRYDLARALVETALRSLKRDKKLLSKHEAKNTIRLTKKIGGHRGH